MAKQTNYFEKFVNDGTAAMQLLSSIHHNKVDGVNIIRFAISQTKEEESNVLIHEDDDKSSASAKSKNEKDTNTFASNYVEDIVNYDNLSIPKPAIYFSINDFVGFRRREEQCYAINGFYVDIDGHNIPLSELDTESEKLENLLNDKFNSGELAPPTRITRTGRGYALFYVLDRNISCKGETERLIKFYDCVYQWLLRAYEDVIKGTRFDVDTCITDRTRVARIPDTLNHKSGTHCRLFDYEGRNYTLAGIMEGCHLQKYVKHDYTTLKGHTGNTKKKGKTCSTKMPKALNRANNAECDDYTTMGMLSRRVKFIKNLVQWKTERGVKYGFRDLACFHYYNSLCQMVDRDEAKQRTRELNASFLEPLPEKELVHAFSPDKVWIVERNIRGYYPFSNEKIINLFRKKDEDLTYEKITELGLYGSKRDLDRAEMKQKTAENRQKKEIIVNKAKKDNPDVYNKDLINIVNKELELNGIKPISYRTLQRILKKLGLGRTGSLSYEETAEFKSEQARKAEVKARKKEREAKKTEKKDDMPKKAQGYCSVPITEEDARRVKPLGSTLQAMQKCCPELNNRMISALLDVYNALSDDNKHIVDLGMDYVLESCKKINYFDCLLFDLDNMFLSMQKKRVRITYRNVLVPSKVYMYGDKWPDKPIPRDIELEMAYKAKLKANTKTEKPIKRIYLTQEEKHIELKEKLREIAANYNQLDSYSLLLKMRKDHSHEVFNVIEVLGRKQTKVVVRFLTVFGTKCAVQDAYDALSETVRLVFNKDLTEMVYQKPKRTEKQKKAFAFWKEIEDMKNSKNNSLRMVSNLYCSIYKKCKDNSAKKYKNTINGDIILLDKIKNDILCQLTINDLKKIASADNAIHLTEEGFLLKIISMVDVTVAKA